MKTILNSNSIIENLKNRKYDTFQELIKSYSGSMRSTIGMYIKNKEDQEDMLQELWLKVWTKIEFFNLKKARLYTWLATIAKNMCIDKLRSKKYTQTTQLISWDDSSTNKHFMQPKVDVIGIGKTLISLRKSERIVTYLFFIKGYNHNEIAEELHIPVGTSKSRLRTGIRHLQENMARDVSYFD